MPIIKRNSTLLKFQKDKGYSLFIIMLFGLPCLLSGLTIITLFGKVTTLKCNRFQIKQVSCEIISSRLLGRKVTSLTNGMLKGAELENGTLKGTEVEPSKTNYRINLITKNSIIPFTDYYSSGLSEKSEKIEKINNFLGNSQELSLIVKQDDRWFAYQLGSVFALVGGWLFFDQLIQLTSKTSLTLDKKSGRISLRKGNIFKSDLKEHPLHEIKAVKVIENSDDQEANPYNMSLILNSGEVIYLDTTDYEKAPYKVSQSIEQFLGLESRS